MTRMRLGHTRTWLIIAALATALMCSTASAEPGFLCTAQGVYTTCTDMGNGTRVCQDQNATGMGVGATEAAGRHAAVLNCSTHMTNMVIIGNMGAGGSTKVPCKALSCAAHSNINTQPTPAAPAEPQASPACEATLRHVCELCGEGAVMCKQSKQTLPGQTDAACEGFKQQIERFWARVPPPQQAQVKQAFCSGEGQRGGGTACDEGRRLICGLCGDTSPMCQGMRARLARASTADCEQELPTLKQGLLRMEELRQSDPEGFATTLQQFCATSP